MKNCVSKTFSVHEIPDLGCADFQRARATTPPVSNRLGMPTAHHSRERALLRDELVSLRRWRNLRRRCTETSSSRRSARSRLWPAVGIPRRFLTGGVVARALWKSAHPRSGISCTGERTSFKTQFFTTQQFFSAICGPERRKNLFQRLVAQNDAEICHVSMFEQKTLFS